MSLSVLCPQRRVINSFLEFREKEKHRWASFFILNLYSFKEDLLNVKVKPCIFSGWTPMSVSLWVMSPLLTWRWWTGAWPTMWFQQKWMSALTWESHPLLTCRFVSGHGVHLHPLPLLNFMALNWFFRYASFLIRSTGVWREDKGLV